MFDSLSEKLSGILDRLTRRGALSEADVDAAMREVRRALLEADVALDVARGFIEQVKKRAVGVEVIKSVTPGQMVVKIVHDEMVATLGSDAQPIDLNAPAPVAVMMVGLQGSGKTTTTAKLAKHLIEKRKKKVLTVSGDVYRPAAIEQLKTVTAQAGAEWFPSQSDQNPLAIAQAALDHAKRHYFDVLLIDTAGRLAIDEALMREIRELHQALNPVETLFVVDAMQGQGEITLRTYAENDQVVVEIADNGPGMSEAIRLRIFEPFFTTKSQGTGLGLAIVNRIAEAHGGEVQVANCPEGGAAFTLRIPNRSSDKEAA